jgi:hypothetical protein
LLPSERPPFTAGVALLSTTVQAHHSIAGYYDSSKRVTVDGVIAQVEFVSPHPLMSLEVQRGTATERWRLEMDNRREFEDIGITVNSFKAGERVVVTGSLARREPFSMYVERLQRPSDGFGSNKPTAGRGVWTAAVSQQESPMTVSKTMRASILIALLAALPSVASAQTVEDRTQDKVAFPAFKIMGNLYYIGTGTLNSYLVTTPAGNILINTNYEDTVPLLKASVESLGFKLTDVKIILGSHAHADHQQADALVKEMTGGAQVMVMDQDVMALNAFKVPSGKPHPNDRVLKDGDTVTLGAPRSPRT